jgi:hypothetical protein
MVAMVVGGSGCAGGGSRAERAKALANSARTRFVYVRPTTKRGSLKPGYTVSARISDGLCLLPGGVVGGVAYTCTGTAGYGIYGPCWPIGEAAKTREVFCVGNPWEHSGTEIGLQERLKVERAKPVVPPDKASIWGVELTSGQRCEHLHGAVSVFRRVPVDFACEGTDLVGAPDRAQALWTIREVVVHRKKEAPASLAAGPLGRIAVVWYGLGAAT